MSLSPGLLTTGIHALWLRITTAPLYHLTLAMSVGLVACGGSDSGRDSGPQVEVWTEQTRVAVGYPFLMGWRSAAATACTASGSWSGERATSGTLSVTPSVTGESTYVLTCRGEHGVAQSTVKVSAVNLQLVAVPPVQTPTPVLDTPISVDAMASADLVSTLNVTPRDLGVHQESFLSLSRSANAPGRWYFYPVQDDSVKCGFAAFEAGSFSRAGCFSWFDEQTWHVMGGGHVRSRAPWWVDANHRHAEPAYQSSAVNPHPGLGYINVLAFVKIPAAAYAPVDMLGAQVRVNLRKDAAFFTHTASSRVGRRKGHIYFWFQTAPRILPSTECTPNPTTGENCTRQSDYILTDSDLSDSQFQIDERLVADEWAQVQIRMRNDARQWTCLGRGDTVKYECEPIEQALRRITYVGFVVAPVCTAPDRDAAAVFTCPENEPTAEANSNRGAVDIGPISILSPAAPSTALPVTWIDHRSPEVAQSLGRRTSAAEQGLNTTPYSDNPVWLGITVSQQAIVRGGGHVDWVVDDTPASKMFGLTGVDDVVAQRAHAYTLSMRSGVVHVIERGAYQATLGEPYLAGDRFRIAVESDGLRTLVKYYKNPGSGVQPFYVSETAAQLPLAAIATDRSTVFAPTLIEGSSELVRWVTPASAELAQQALGGLVKVRGESWSPVAHSYRLLASGDGYLEFVVPNTTSACRVGLAPRNSGPDINTMGAHLYIPNLRANDKEVYVVAPASAGGPITYRGVGSYQAGDRFRIAVEDGKVTYRKNGILLFQAREQVAAETYPLRANVSLSDVGSRMETVELAGTLIDPAP